MEGTERNLEQQAKACEMMGSPFTAQVVREALVDYREGGRVRDLLDAHQGYARPGLHLAGALHYLALAGEPSLAKYYPSVGGNGDGSGAWAAARQILAREPERIAELYAHAVQTNEPARSMSILGALLCAVAKLPMPVRLFEVGASAGLNLRFDRYGYDGGGWQWGDSDSPLVLRNRIARGRPKHLDAKMEIVERRGCDLHPVDVNSAQERLRLTSFVWPDQVERLQRLQAGLEVAAAVPATIDAESFATWLPREATPQTGRVTAIVHTIVEEYFTAEERRLLREIVTANAERASAVAPLVYVRMELKGRTYPTTLATWPGAECVTICTSDGHAQGLRWT